MSNVVFVVAWLLSKVNEVKENGGVEALQELWNKLCKICLLRPLALSKYIPFRVR